MDRNTFIESIVNLEAQFKIDLEVSENLGKVFTSAHTANLLPNNSLLVESYIRLLSLSMGDNNNWIEYYIYELNFGKSYEDGKVTMDRVNVELSNPSDLYDFLNN